MSRAQLLSEAAAFPDPLLSANFYAFRRLDRVIARAVVPFVLAAEASPASHPFYLWLLRYACGGEHLKIRVHGPESLREPLSLLLERAVEAGRAAGEEIPVMPRRLVPPPPMDREDQGPADGYPDGTFLYTHYRRSPVVFGASPLLDDDLYAALFTSCLGRACRLALESFELDETGHLPHRRRQALLLKVLTAGLPALFAGEELRRYAVYHRDWLVRARSLASRGGMEKARQILEQYASEAARIGPSSLTGIPALLQGAEPPGLWEREWRRSLVAFRAYVQEIQAPDPDPFVPGPLYPSLFKVFHCVANQLGLTPLNEGLTWHLLLNAVAGSENRDGFRLVPLDDPGSFGEHARAGNRIRL